MANIRVLGLDIAKSVFQLHGVDADGATVLQRRVIRGRMLAFFAKLSRCLIGIEACASSHYWAHELIALGHEVKLMPAQYVKPYVRRSKNDAADAEAICEAVTRPTMRFVGIKSPEQQSAMMLHRVRLILSRQRTQLSNALRAHVAEFGILAPIGRNGIDRLLVVIADPADGRLPDEARLCLDMLVAQLSVAFGAFFPSTTKDKGDAERPEPELIEFWAGLFEIPCVAIGGITPDNCMPLVEAGADFLAVSGGVWNGDEVVAIEAFAKVLRDSSAKA